MFRVTTCCCAMGTCSGRTPGGLALAAAARTFVGVRFRPQGRSRGGVDCLGLVLLSALACGVRLEARADYGLRCNQRAEVERGLLGSGARRAPAGCRAPGAIRLGEAVPGQIHFAVQAEASLIEADASVGRVVERPIEGFRDEQDRWLLPVR